MARRPCGRTIRTWRPASTISRYCCKPRTASARPSRSIAARSRSTRRASGRTIPTWRSPQQSRVAAPSHEPPRRGRAALSPRARDRRGELRAGPSRRRDRPQQSRDPAPSHEPPRRGRAALSPRAGDRRGEPTGRTIPMSRSASTISRPALRHEPPRRGRAALSPRARDRRGELRAGPSRMWRRASTISRACSKPRTASARPSRSIRRALAIDEASYGPDHPNVAIDLNNLAEVAPRHEPPRRGRAALSPRAGDRRSELRAGPSRTWRIASTISRSLLQSPGRTAFAGAAEPAHDAARSLSSRRASGRR